MRIDDSGPADPQGRARDDPPAHLPRGQLLRRPPARLALGARARRRRRDPVNQTRAGPVRPGPHRAAVRHAARTCRCCSSEYGARLSGRRRPRLQPLDPVLEGRLPRRTPSSPTPRSGIARARPLGLHQERRRRSPRALDRDPEALKALITDFDTTAGAFAAEQANLAGRGRRAAAHAARRAAGARRAQRRVPAAAPRSSPTCGPACARPRCRRSTPSCRSCEQLRGLVGAGRAARPVRRPAPRRARLAALNDETVPLYEQVRLPPRCQNEVDPAVVDRTRSPDPIPGRAARSTRRRVKPLPGLAGESRSFDANGQWFARARAPAATLRLDGSKQPGSASRPRAAAPGRQPAEGADARRRCATTCRARRRSRPTCSSEPGAAAGSSGQLDTSAARQAYQRRPA